MGEFRRHPLRRHWKRLESCGHYWDALDHQHGFWIRLPDPHRIIHALVAIWVLLAVPAQLTEPIATRGMGHLSQLDRPVLEEPFDVQSQTVATVLLASTLSL